MTQNRVISDMLDHFTRGWHARLRLPIESYMDLFDREGRRLEHECSSEASSIGHRAKETRVVLDCPSQPDHTAECDDLSKSLRAYRESLLEEHGAGVARERWQTTRTLLICELAVEDFHQRCNADMPVAAKSYFDRFEELAEKLDIATELIMSELDFRKSREQNFDSQLFWEQLPSYRIPFALCQDGYTPLSVISQGGMGVVIKARAKPPQVNLVAIKYPRTLDNDCLTNELRKRFEHEQRIISRLTHPNIYRIYDVGDASGCPYMVVDYLDGLPLDKWSRQENRQMYELVDALSATTSAIDHMHAQNITHRDIKPENILATWNCEIYVTDFSLSRDDQTETPEGDPLSGSENTLAPEGSLNKQSDIYSLGRTFQLVFDEFYDGDRSGQSPTPKTNWFEILRGIFRRRFPSDLSRVLDRATAHEASARYQCLSQMTEDLRRYRNREPLKHARDVGLLGKTLKTLQRRPRETALVALFVLAMLLSFVWFDNRSNRAFLQQIEQVFRVDDSKDDELIFRLVDKGYQKNIPTFTNRHKEYTKQLIARSRLSQNEISSIRKHIQWIRRHDEITAVDLTRRLNDKTTNWQKTGNLVIGMTDSPPLPSGLFSRIDARIVSTEWYDANLIGVAMNVSDLQSGYRFLIRVLDDSATFRTLGDADVVSIEIRKEDILLSQQFVDVTSIRRAEITLTASREIDRLAFHVNHHVEVSVDVIPLPAEHRENDEIVKTHFDTMIPDFVGQANVVVRVFDKPLPASPSTLEQGDVCFARKRYREAEEFYSNAVLSVDPKLRHEAVFKHALAIANQRGGFLRRFTSKSNEGRALNLFVDLANDSEASKWSWLAAFHAASIYFDREDSQPADVMLDRLEKLERQLVDPSLLPMHLSDDERNRFLQAYTPYSMSGSLWFFLRHDPKRINKLLRAIGTLHRIGSKTGTLLAQHELVKARWVTETLEGITLAKQEIESLIELPGLDPSWQMTLWRDHVWIVLEYARSRSNKDEILNKVLKQLDAVIAIDPNELAVLFVQRANIQIGLGNFEQAERDLSAFFERRNGREFLKPKTPHGPPDNMEGIGLLDGSLMLGFLHWQKNRKDEAIEAWQRGFELTRQHTVGAYYEGAVLGSLCGQLDSTDVINMITHTTRKSGILGSTIVRFLKAQMDGQSGHLAFIRTVLQDAWISDIGRKSAKELAFRQMSFRQFTRMQTMLWLREGFIRAFTGIDHPARKLSGAENEFVWSLCQQLEESYSNGELTEDQIIQLISTAGAADGLPWASFWIKRKPWHIMSNELAPELRSRVSLVLAAHAKNNLKDDAKARLFLDSAFPDLQGNPVAEDLRNAIQTSP